MDKFKVQEGLAWLDAVEDSIIEHLYSGNVSKDDIAIWKELRSIEGNLHDALFDWYMKLRAKGFFNRELEEEMP